MEDIFYQNPNLKMVYVTSDEQAFYHEHDAKNHAKTLDDKSVEPLYNPHISDEFNIEDEEDFFDENSNEYTEDVEKEATKKEAAEKEAAEKEAAEKKSKQTKSANK